MKDMADRSQRQSRSRFFHFILRIKTTQSINNHEYHVEREIIINLRNALRTRRGGIRFHNDAFAILSKSVGKVLVVSTSVSAGSIITRGPIRAAKTSRRSTVFEIKGKRTRYDVAQITNIPA